MFAFLIYIFSPPVLPAIPAEQANQPSTSSSVEEFSLPDISQGTAQLVFYRPPRMSYAFLGCGIVVNGNRISSLGNGRYFVMAVAPGAHEIAVDGYRRSIVRVTINLETRTFLRCSMKPSFPRANPELSLEQEANAIRDIAHLAYVDPDDASSYVIDVVE